MQEHTIQSLLPDLIAIRRRLHRIPELGLEEHRTSDLIAETLASWGYEVTRNLATTGIVASRAGPVGGGSIGFRADFDALPMEEETGLAYASHHPGTMHACGHDGHTAMLLGAAWALSLEPAVPRTVHFIFQPAEENLGGGKLMIDDGLFERFPCDLVFALHNWPGLKAGTFSSRVGPITASIDAATVTIRGKGGHGAAPHETIDPVVVGSSIVMALQTIVSRNVAPQRPAVVTVGAFRAGSASNVIPDTAALEIGLRATDPDVRRDLRAKVEAVAGSQAAVFGAHAAFEWHLGYPTGINDEQAVRIAERAIVGRFGEAAFVEMDLPLMGSEDFSFFLERVPGAFVLIGNGDGPGLHTSRYDFNDEILERGATFFFDLATSRRE